MLATAMGIGKILTPAVFYDTALYQCIDTKNPFFLQEIAHIKTFLNQSVSSSPTRDLLLSIAEVFRVDIGFPFYIARTEYKEKTFIYYLQDGWYKSLWKFNSKACYKLDITKDYEDLPLILSKEVYLMQAFVNNGYKGEDLKQHNFV